MFHSIEEAIQDLKNGKPVIVVDDEDRENEGDFIALAEKTDAAMINFMVTYGRGLVCVPITEERAAELKLELMVDRNTDAYGTAFTVSIDEKTTTTGISAHERAQTVQALLDPASKPEDFRRPGHIWRVYAARIRPVLSARL
jgi:3,4-dihydroxy 2-butanone 4-phosphate synthase/GTP cyclohydrolase II